MAEEKRSRPSRRPRRDGKKDNDRAPREPKDPRAYLADWTPRTDLGLKVKNKEITDIDQILDKGLKILEPEIVDTLIETESELILIGQSKGKFGGGARRVFRQTQKKTMEGNKPQFSAFAIVGNKDGYVGMGLGKSKETIPAREKAVRNAKINIFRIRRGAGSWEDASAEPHSIPFAVTGKCGSVEVTLKPAPKGKGLIVEKELGKILELAGIKDCWSKTQGQSKNKVNLVKAAEDALRQLSKVKIKHDQIQQFSIIEGRAGKQEKPAEEEVDAQ